MSRTIRNKKNQVRRYCGYYKDQEFSTFDNTYKYDYFGLYEFQRYNFKKSFESKLADGWESGWHSSPYVLRKKKTKVDFYKERKYRNGESSNRNEYTPSRLYRNNAERELRAHNKMELIKYIAREDYEPVCYENPSSHLWEWR